MPNRPPTRATISTPALPFISPQEWTLIAKTLRLTPRQLQVVQLIFQAKKDKQIAAAMAVNIWTVRAHLTEIFTRTGVSDRTEMDLHVFGTLRGDNPQDALPKTALQELAP